MSSQLKKIRAAVSDQSQIATGLNKNYLVWCLLRLVVQSAFRSENSFDPCDLFGSIIHEPFVQVKHDGSRRSSRLQLVCLYVRVCESIVKRSFCKGLSFWRSFHSGESGKLLNDKWTLTDKSTRRMTVKWNSTDKSTRQTTTTKKLLRALCNVVGVCQFVIQRV